MEIMEDIFDEDVSVNDSEREMQVENTHQPATHTVTLWGVQIFKKWLTEKNISQNFENDPEEEIDKLLARFYSESRKKGGSPYNKTALYNVRSALQRYLRSPPWNKRFNITKNHRFDSSNKVLLSLPTKVKARGKPVTRHCPIDQSEFRALYKNGVISTCNPRSLQNLVWLHVAMHFGLQDMRHLKEMTPKSFILNTDEEGRRYIECSNKGLQDSSEANETTVILTVRIYERPKDPLCPVYAINVYRSLINHAVDFFWQRPDANYRKTGNWYLKQPLGIYSLYYMMKGMCKEARLNHLHTNFCLRTTSRKLLSAAGLEKTAAWQQTKSQEAAGELLRGRIRRKQSYALSSVIAVRTLPPGYDDEDMPSSEVIQIKQENMECDSVDDAEDDEYFKYENFVDVKVEEVDPLDIPSTSDTFTYEDIPTKRPRLESHEGMPETETSQCDNMTLVGNYGDTYGNLGRASRPAQPRTEVISMMSLGEDAVAAVAAAYIVIALGEKRRKVKQKPRRCWMRKFLADGKAYGDKLMTELRLEDGAGFRNFFRTTPSDFEMLLQMIGSKISRMDTKYRASIPAKIRLAVTLRYLASGDSFTSLMYKFKISKQSISIIVPEVCEALTDALKEYVKMPETEQEWYEIENGFTAVWDFPHCLGAMDGKHIQIQAPKNSGSMYKNYIGNFSVVLYIIVDAHYNVIYADVACQSQISGDGVLKTTSLYEKMEKNKLNLPSAQPLVGRNIPVPYVFVASDSFSLSNRVINPIPGCHVQSTTERIFNYRLSRAQKIVENVFGLLSAIFRVFLKPIQLHPNKVKAISLTCVYLYNFFRRNTLTQNIYAPSGTFDVEDILNDRVVPGYWRDEVDDNDKGFIDLQTVAKSARTEEDIRKEFCEYFVSTDGKVSWQDKFI